MCFADADRSDEKNVLVLAQEVLLRHRSPETPVVIARDVGGAEESVRIVPLGELNSSIVDMRCLLIIGSSQTQWYTADTEDVVFTPRRYPG